uniref:RHS repeat-associated core domain-containing protein n=1 Tax=Pseudomonas sp. LAM2023 TaxID=2800477 RepID=UPI001F3085A7
FTLFGWDGDTLAWESSPPRDDGDTGRTVHYLYEPGSFVPVAQALRKSPIRLHKQPDWSQREYDFDQDPLWHTEVKPQAFDAIAWYQCDHLGTPMELTDEQGNVAWAGQYKAWGEVREERSAWAKQHGLGNPIRFQGQYHDQETGLNYNRYRYYSPQTGRFVNHDPINYAGGLNLYLYAANPVTWIDPLGLARIKGITPNNKGTRTTIEADNLEGAVEGYSVKAGGLGAHHPVVKELYDDAERAGVGSPFNGHCGEADGLSRIAHDNDVQTVRHLRRIVSGGTSTTVRNDGKPMPYCSSCAHVMAVLGVDDGCAKNE